RYESAAVSPPSANASSAARACGASRSGSAYTATLGNPASRAALATRTAISPRLAISTLPIRRVPAVPVLVPTALSACCTPGPPPTTESFLLCSVGHSDRTQGESRITYRRLHGYRP